MQYLVKLVGLLVKKLPWTLELLKSKCIPILTLSGMFGVTKERLEIVVLHCDAISNETIQT